MSVAEEILETNGTEEILNKIANWDLEEDLGGGNFCDSTEAVIYNQVQAFFKRHKQYIENISRISRQLDVVVHDFMHEAGQVEQVADFLKKGAGKQTQGIEKSVKLIEDFTEKINAIYGKSKSIISLAYDMDKTNQSVRESVEQLVTNQAKNDEAVNDIFGVIKNLINKTQKIGEITKLINRISSETNLLGLNAKVEAAHAGAAGKGFSVVADEIQRLSEESRTANENIRDTIKGVTDEINLLQEVALKSQGTFKTQGNSVSDVRSAFEKTSEFINTYISEQKSFNSSIEEIKSDEDVLANSISEVFGSVREVTATANEISSLTYNQNSSISLLKKLDADLADGAASVCEESSNIKVHMPQTLKRKIAFLFDHDNPFYDPTKKEAVKAADTYNYEISFQAPKSRGISGVNEMSGMLDKIIEEKVDGLVISPIDNEIIYQKLKKINSMGVKVVFINSKLDGIDYVSYIQTNGIAAGEAAAQVLMGVMGNQGEVIVNAWSDTQISAIEDRRVGFVKKLRDNTKIEVHEVPVKGKPSIEESEKTIHAMLNQYPDVRHIFLTNCDWALLFANYMKKYRPDIQLITVDYTKDLQEAMSKGYIHYALGQRNYSWGTMAMNFIDKSFNNEPVQKYVDTGIYEANQQNMNIYKSFLS